MALLHEEYSINDLNLISRGLYCVLDRLIGDVEVVSLRRKKYKLSDILHNLDPTNTHVRLVRGSKAEGFEMGSDIDIMFCDKTAIVVPMEKLCLDFNEYDTLLTMENSSPGFVYVKCLKVGDSSNLIRLSVRRHGIENYVNSKIYREVRLSVLGNPNEVTIHGPCMAGISGNEVYDMLHCLFSPFWPDQAYPFLRRSIRAGWPSHNTLTEICKCGCLLVPINSKETYTIDDCDLQWRLSFSLAESKLVESMDHVQFLCLGLLKIFFKEVLYPYSDDLLCSYYFKNAILWEISESKSVWNMGSFIFHFWKTFRRLIKWISIGHCPHFFIPERNLFYGRISRSQRSHLQRHISSIHDEGLNSFLRAVSLRDYFLSTLQQPSVASMLFTNNTDVSIISEQLIYTLDFILEFRRSTVIDSYRSFLFEFHNAFKVEHVRGSDTFTAAMSLRINYILQRILEKQLAFTVPAEEMNLEGNRKNYYSRRKSFNLMRRIKTFVFESELITLKHMYRFGQYRKAIKLCYFLVSSLEFSSFTYEWIMNVDVIMSARQRSVPWKILVNKHIASFVTIRQDDTIDELLLESSVTRLPIFDGDLKVPPLVFVKAILLLCCDKLGFVPLRNAILQELFVLVTYDNYFHICKYHRAISLQLLGICQMVCSDMTGAFNSFMYAFIDPYNFFKSATLTRLLCTLLKSFQNSIYMQ